MQTVYYVFGTKRNLLAAVLDTSASPVTTNRCPCSSGRGSSGSPPHPTRSRPCELLVEAAVAIIARTASIYEVVRRAAADPEVGDLLADNRRARTDRPAPTHRDAGRDAGHLRPDLDVDTAADVFYALMNEEVFQLLRRGLRLGRRAVPRWATGLLVDQLADRSPVRGEAANNAADTC